MTSPYYQSRADSVLADYATNGSIPVRSGTLSRVSTAEYQRPANTTAYTAGDVIADSTTAPTTIPFGGVARTAGGTGKILDAQIKVYGYTASPPSSLELWLFQPGTITPINDNDPFAISNAALDTLVCVIPFTVSYVGNPSTTGIQGSRVWQATNLNLAFDLGSGVTSLEGILRVGGAYTPVSGETFFIHLKVQQD